MNIKYISLLSFLFVANTQCTEKTAPEKLDLKKEAYLDCRKSWWYKNVTKHGTCDLQWREFELARQEFLQPLREKSEKGLREYNEFKQKSDRLYFWQRSTITQEQQEAFFKTRGRGCLVEAFEDSTYYDFANSNKSTEQLAQQVLDSCFSLNNSCMQEAVILWGNDKNKIDKAKNELMEEIKHQS